ncbi:hypothetical protein ROZALSC1DRAFT_23317, partial [Rozella allomycis CSF55]
MYLAIVITNSLYLFFDEFWIFLIVRLFYLVLIVTSVSYDSINHDVSILVLFSLNFLDCTLNLFGMTDLISMMTKVLVVLLISSFVSIMIAGGVGFQIMLRRVFVERICWRNVESEPMSTKDDWIVLMAKSVSFPYSWIKNLQIKSKFLKMGMWMVEGLLFSLVFGKDALEPLLVNMKIEYLKYVCKLQECNDWHSLHQDHVEFKVLAVSSTNAMIEYDEYSEDWLFTINGEFYGDYIVNKRLNLLLFKSLHPNTDYRVTIFKEGSN